MPVDSWTHQQHHEYDYNMLAQRTDVPDACLVSCTTTVLVVLLSAHMCWYYTVLVLFSARIC